MNRKTHRSKRIYCQRILANNLYRPVSGLLKFRALNEQIRDSRPVQVAAAIVGHSTHDYVQFFELEKESVEGYFIILNSKFDKLAQILTDESNKTEYIMQNTSGMMELIEQIERLNRPDIVLISLTSETQ